MRFEGPRVNYDSNLTEVILHHQGKSIKWAYTAPEKSNATRRVVSEDLFSEINDFWSSLPGAAQTELFSVYDRISAAMSNPRGTKEISLELIPLFAQIYDILRLEDISQWARMYDRIHLPPNVDEKYSSGADENKSRELTYIRSDYWNLLVMVIALRAILPIWNQFIDYTKRDAGPNWKEQQAYLLLSRSRLWNCEPMERMRLYVEHRFRTNKQRPDSAILDSVGTEEFPDWLMGLVIVRRISNAEVIYTPTSVPLLSIVFNFINEKINRNPTNFLGFVKDKSPEAGSVDSEGHGNKNSLLEGYKIQTETTAGHTALINAHALDFEHMRRLFASDVPAGIINQVQRNIKPLRQHRVYPGQRAIVQNVMAKVIPPATVQHLSRQALLNMVMLSQAALWYRGHKEIAALLTAIPINEDETAHLMDSGSRTRYSKEMLAELDRLYPYQRPQSGRNRNVKQTNDGVGAIETIVAELDQRSWRLVLPESWMNELVDVDAVQHQHPAVPANIRNLLAMLARDINSDIAPWSLTHYVL